MGKTLSLAIIAGNVEGYIGRFLDSFQPLVDEVVVVRAIGCEPPDNTLDICKSRGCVVGVYDNAAHARDWPHVDDFAAARNKAWSMASGDWLMWADTDDILPDGSGHGLREFLDATDADMIVAPYVIPDRGVSVDRERIMRRGVGKWRYPVHENVSVDGDIKVVKLTDFVIEHRPNHDKTGSGERNLRILSGIDPGQYDDTLRYHYHAELVACGRDQDAIDAGVSALKSPTLAGPERYEILLNMAKLDPIGERKSAWLHEAYKVAPERREALAHLACLAMDMGQQHRGLAYASAMHGVPRPPESLRPWSHREPLYGWAGTAILTQALRMCGESKRAITIEDRIFDAAGGKISLLHATRGRPKQATMARKEWLTRAHNPAGIEHIFAIDADDEASAVLRRFRSVVLPGGEGGCVAAWNGAASLCRGDVLVQLSDDWIPPVHWDKIILERLGDLAKPSVLAVSDGSRTDDLLCMAIMTRARYEQAGYMFDPGFTGVWSDNWFSVQAIKDGVVIDARDVVFEHLHPLFGKARMDDTYHRQNNKDAFEKGKQHYNELCKLHGYQSLVQP